METNSDYNRRIEELECQLTRQKTAVEELRVLLEHCANGVLRHDQAVFLDNFKAKVMEKVEDAQIREVVAANAFTKEKFTTVITKFAIGTLGGAMSGEKNPLLRGVSSVKPILRQKAPFNTVLVAIGKEGLPQDVRVVRLSRLARDSNRSETEVTEDLRNRGYLLMTPQTFVALVDSLKCRVLDGSLSLPLSVDKIVCELAGIPRRPE